MLLTSGKSHLVAHLNLIIADREFDTCPDPSQRRFCIEAVKL